ncbi:CBS domain-containing protein [uncultured Sulfitobacter sp.]|uniref:CBS domain-containing protein n=1 Tax=uncultured Sulfitobacter sp. TaxID=191468 RepID=UPI0026017E37|nr:CBS domain-containing protein [uncultured Sulfitobacter sp.]
MTAIALVSDYMTRDLITLSPETEINHAMNLLLNNRISGAPVLDASGQLVGVLSKKDCLKAALEASYYRDWGRTVASYMTTQVETVEAGMDILAVTEAFLKSHYRRFPVFENGQLVGQISRADVLRAMNDNWS